MWGVDQAKEIMKWKKIQDEVKKHQSQVFATVEKHGVKIVMKGDKKLERVELDGIEDKDIKDAVNEAMKEIDKKLQKKLQGQAGELGITS